MSTPEQNKITEKGIDFGTTQSSCSFYDIQQEKFNIANDETDSPQIASMLSFPSDGKTNNVIFGNAVKNNPSENCCIF